MIDLRGTTLPARVTAVIPVSLMGHATTFVAVHHRHENILTLIAAILEALDGNEKPLHDARLWPLSNVLSEVHETIRANTGSPRLDDRPSSRMFGSTA
ncbi:MAG: hypothetical protein U0270_11075 [Labilithrix sp.]